MSQWMNGRLFVDPPKKPKKITGTRLGAILGVSPWSTPFEAWCEITRTYQEPIEDTIYLNAGKTIEPIQIQYMKDKYFMNVQTPTDVYGKDYFKKTYGDFYPNDKVFGGMWDARELDEETGVPISILEFKTTKRSEDWLDDIPEYYALQAALYGHLSNIDDIYLVCSFLEEEDYINPANFKPSVQNTIVRHFSIRERYGDFEKNVIKPAMKFWKECVKTGNSPKYDPVKDKEILDILRTTIYEPSEDVSQLLDEIEKMNAEVEKVKAEIKPTEDKLKKAKDKLKDILMNAMGEDDIKASATYGDTVWTLSKSESIKYDTKKLDADGMGEKYGKTSVTYTLRSAKAKEKE